MVRHRYGEGDWFAIPLGTGGFALGLVARANPRGVLLGYFFGPRRGHLPVLLDTMRLLPDEAVLVGKFGHLRIQGGSWPLLGRQESWDRTSWPTPVFTRYEELTGRSFHVRYDDSDPNRVIEETLVKPGLAEHGPRDGLMGAGFVEQRLSALLDKV